jgi:hypothetical protein
MLKKISFASTIREAGKETRGMPEANLRRLLDFLLEEAKHLGPRYVIDGKMAIPPSVVDVESSPGDRSTRYPN